MVADLVAAEAWVVLEHRARELAGKFWPGALTLVLRATPRAEVSLGQVVSDGTLAIRIPDHPVALRLLAALAQPLCTSSANRAGEPRPARALRYGMDSMETSMSSSRGNRGGATQFYNST